MIKNLSWAYITDSAGLFIKVRGLGSPVLSEAFINELIYLFMGAFILFFKKIKII